MRARNADIETIQDACRENPMFFGRYVKTQDPQADNPIRPWPLHEEYLTNAIYRFIGARILVVYKKSRQMMLSWAACYYAIWYAGFFHNRQIMIQSIKEEAAKGLIARMTFMLIHLPKWLLPCDYTITAGKITFHHKEGPSWVMAVPSGANQIRSWSPTVVIFDESAWQKEIEAAHAAARPAVRGGGQIIHISTPGEADSPEAEFFKDLVQGGRHQVLELHYSMMEGRTQDDWDRIRKEDGYDDAQWSREMEGSFNVGGGLPVFKPPFDRSTYVNDTLVYNPSLELLRGIDYGVRHPACIWAQYQPRTKQLYLLHSFTGDNITLPQFALEVIRRTAQLIAPCPMGRTLRERTWDDPAGMSRKDIGISSRQALNAAGIYPCNSSKKVPIKESVSLLRERLQIKVGADRKSRPGMLFHPSCTNLIDAMDGKYAEDKQVRDKYRGGITEHEVDALRYLCAGRFNLGDK